MVLLLPSLNAPTLPCKPTTLDLTNCGPHHRFPRSTAKLDTSVGFSVLAAWARHVRFLGLRLLHCPLGVLLSEMDPRLRQCCFRPCLDLHSSLLFEMMNIYDGTGCDKRSSGKFANVGLSIFCSGLQWLLKLVRAF